MNLSPSIYSRLQHQHESLSSLVSGFTDEELRKEIIPGKWNTLQQVAHLSAYQPTFLQRIKLIQVENGPRFDRYTAENDPLFHEQEKWTVQELIAQIGKDRSAILEELEGLAPARFSRIGHHPVFGAMTITDWTEFFLLHEAHHLFSVFKLVRNLKTA